jgi:lysophospholipase L1-like esterase
LLSGQTPLITDAAPYSEAYINGVYRDALGRSADATALNWFTQQIDQGQSPAIVPGLVVQSNEYATNLVHLAYQRYLGRDAGSEEAAYWTGRLVSDLRDEQFVAAIVASEEFYIRAGGNNAAWIAAAYQATLGRAAQPADVQQGIAALALGVPLDLVALTITSSVEYERQIVNADYEHYTHSAPDSKDWTNWAMQLASGQSTAESLAGQLMRGNTYYDIQTGVPPSVVPVPNDMSAWHMRNAQVASAAAVNTGSVVFVGDSITQGWQLPTGQPVWNEYFAPLHAFEAGVGGDTTENVLWRVESGELDGLAPKVVVLMVGVNNIINGDSPQVVADGVAADIAVLQQHFPTSKILLLSILPAIISSADLNFMAPIAATNPLIAGLADGQKVTYFDLWPAFTNPDGTYRPELHIADGVHLNTAGYAVFAQTIAPELNRLLSGS